MALELIRINTAGMTPEQLYEATNQKLENLVQQLNMKLLLFDDQDTNIIETRKTILTVEMAQSEFEQVVTNNIAAIDGNIYKIHGELADYKKVVAQELTAVDGYISNLRGDFADYKVIVADNFTATNGTILTLTGDLADYKKIVAGELEAATGTITVLKGELVDYKKVIAGELEATNGKILTLSGDLASYKKVIAGDLSAINGNIQNLVSDIGSISTLLFGSATGTTITTEFANTIVSHIGEAQIHSGMIKDLAFDKITGFDVNTTNLMIHSEDGKSQWKDNTIQISDANRVRVQIGKDAGDDYSMYVWDATGKLMFDALGLTDNGIQREIIRDDMVSKNASIDASKLDIRSLFREINGSTETIETGRMTFDGKSLDLFLGSMSDTVTDQGKLLSSQGTQITAIQGDIASRIWKQDIDTATKQMNTQYSTLEQSLNGITTRVGSTESNLTGLSSRVTEAEKKITKEAIISTVSGTYATTSDLDATNDKFSNYPTTTQMNSAIKQTAENITSTVSTTYTTKTEFNALDVGDRNLLLKSGGASVSSSYAIQDYYFGDERPVEGETYTIVMKATLASGKSNFQAYNSGGSISLAVLGSESLANGIYRKTFVWRVGSSDNTFLRIYHMPSSVTATSTIEWMKLVKGNKTSNTWTPALEDVDESIGLAQDDAADAKTAVENMGTTITQLSDSISQLVVGKDGQSLMKQTESGWVFDMNGILGNLDSAADNISNLSEGINGLNDNIGTLKEQVKPLSEMNAYIMLSKNAAIPYIELGSKNSAFKVRITNTAINFMEGQDTPAYINNQKLNIKKATVEEELQFGGFVWTERTNGNMGLLWKG